MGIDKTHGASSSFPPNINPLSDNSSAKGITTNGRSVTSLKSPKQMVGLFKKTLGEIHDSLHSSSTKVLNKVFFLKPRSSGSVESNRIPNAIRYEEPKEKAEPIAVETPKSEEEQLTQVLDSFKMGNTTETSRQAIDDSIDDLFKRHGNFDL